jgi:hypothetical protein
MEEPTENPKKTRTMMRRDPNNGTWLEQELREIPKNFKESNSTY